MGKLSSLLKAIMSQDMNLFRFKAKKGTSQLKKLLFPVILSLIFMCSIGTYLYIFGVELSKLNLTYVMLTFGMIVPVIFTLIEGIYKSQGMLFETKDNDLLFSLPIKKSTIILARLVKLYVFQFIYNMLFILPAYVLYAFFEKPGVNFYVISVIMALLLPIIPTIISCFIGFLIKSVSSKFKAKKITQTALTMLIFLGIMFLSLNMNSIITNMIENASSINEIISKIYYPIGLYIGLINDFNVVDLLKLILINAIPLILFVVIVSKYYFSIVSKSVEKTSATFKAKSKNVLYKQRKPLKALVMKELKRFFSSPVYMFNTLFGVILMFVATLGMCINLEGTLNVITEGEGIGVDIDTIKGLMPKIFFCIIVFTSCMTSITSSAISLEGKSFTITKSLPVKADKILFAKIISSNMICIPVILVCDFIFFAVYKPAIIDILLLLLISFIMPTFTAIVGLLANLKYPKMNATSDTEVVKQSMSSAISVLGGMVVSIILIGALVLGAFLMEVNVIATIEVVVLALIVGTLWKVLKSYGARRVKEIE